MVSPTIHAMPTPGPHEGEHHSAVTVTLPDDARATPAAQARGFADAQDPCNQDSIGCSCAQVCACSHLGALVMPCVDARWTGTVVEAARDPDLPFMSRPIFEFLRPPD